LISAILGVDNLLITPIFGDWYIHDKKKVSYQHVVNIFINMLSTPLKAVNQRKKEELGLHNASYQHDNNNI